MNVTRNLEVIYAGEIIEDARGPSVFLAGPTPRDGTEGWRPEAIDIFKSLEFEGDVFIPEPRTGWKVGVDYSNQIDWERDAMENADIVMFWIPRELEKMPAFTTNIEFGYWLAKDPSKIKIGHPPTAPHMKYIDYKCEQNKIWPEITLTRLINDVVWKLHKRGMPNDI
jgi:hypothetical protein